MKHFASLFALASIAAALPLHAQVQLDSVGNLAVPEGHSYIIGITNFPYQDDISAGQKLMVYTTQETYQTDYVVTPDGASRRERK